MATVELDWLLCGLDDYIFNNYIPELPRRSVLSAPTAKPKAERGVNFNFLGAAPPAERDYMPMACEAPEEEKTVCCAAADIFDAEAKRSFELDESFSRRVQRLMTEKGLTAPECYNRALMDRRLFSRICSSDSYHPRKNTALALAVALELSLEETNEFLKTAGYSLSKSILTDVIVEYFIRNGYYDIFAINEALYAHDAELLG